MELTGPFYARAEGDADRPISSGTVKHWNIVYLTATIDNIWSNYETLQKEGRGEDE